MVPDVQMEDMPKFYAKIYTIIFNNIMIIISDIYVSNTEYLILEISINWERKNSQNFMLVHPILHNISIDTYKQ